MATKITLDDETAAVLARFNEGLERTKEQQRREKVVTKAERSKDEAAKKVKALEGADGSSEDRAEAQEEYRKAVERWQSMKTRLDAGEDPDPPVEEPDEAATEVAEAEVESAGDEATTAEEPAAETPDATEPITDDAGDTKASEIGAETVTEKVGSETEDDADADADAGAGDKSEEE